jgi:hypothetical protein
MTRISTSQPTARARRAIALSAARGVMAGLASVSLSGDVHDLCGRSREEAVHQNARESADRRPRSRGVKGWSTQPAPRATWVVGAATTIG